MRGVARRFVPITAAVDTNIAAKQDQQPQANLLRLDAVMQARGNGAEGPSLEATAARVTS